VFADCTDESMPLLDFAHAVEELGYSGLFLNEHTHVPVDHPRSAFPYGGEIPERYARFWDPYTALSFVAATTGLEVGPFVSLVGEHDPIVLAKTIATLDVLSGGRFLLGVGWGWLREEFEDHGFPARERVAVITEKIALMKAVWTQDVASFEGSYVRLPPSWSWPKPAQRPHPPVLIGAPANARNFERIAAWADGWITMGTPDLSTFDRTLAELRRVWDFAGREGAPRVTVSFRTVPLEGLADATQRCAELGIERVVLRVPDEEPQEAVARLTRSAAEFARALGV
jgi:probable F420-dependent oxidoreductase